MRYSFLIPYYNRESLRLTLTSFLHFYKERKDFEIIIIEERKNVLNEEYHRKLRDTIDAFKNFFSIKHLEYDKETYNPAPLYNLGEKNSIGQFLILTNPECFHMTDILHGFDEEIYKNPNAYIICGCQNVSYSGSPYDQFINFNNFTPIEWYQHTTHSDRQLHFCSCIAKMHYQRIGGFDEEYAKGMAYDDNDLINTIKAFEIPIVTKDELLIYHIHHPKQSRAEYPEKWQINADYYVSKWETPSIRRAFKKNNQKIDIYMTSFFRLNFTLESIQKIHERTERGTFNIHVFDNGSDSETQEKLYGLLKTGIIKSLHLDSRNTGCLYNKLVFQAMTETQNPYYIVTDNDVFPPALTPSWLVRMVEIMEDHPELAFLTPQLPPVEFQMPYDIKQDLAYCKAVGNTFKMVRRNAFPRINQISGSYGDDALVCEKVHENGWKVAFCRNVFCWHAGQMDNWGYKPEEVKLDQRKSGYKEFFSYEPVDINTYEPPPNLKY